jgi:hypothetical protein
MNAMISCTTSGTVNFIPSELMNVSGMYPEYTPSGAFRQLF